MIDIIEFMNGLEGRKLVALEGWPEGEDGTELKSKCLACCFAPANFCDKVPCLARETGDDRDLYYVLEEAQ